MLALGAISAGIHGRAHKQHFQRREWQREAPGGLIISRILKAFVESCNVAPILIDHKEEIIQIYEDTMRERCNTSMLTERLGELRTELEIITEHMKRHITANAHMAVIHAEYQRQYVEYEVRFHEVQRRISEARCETVTAKESSRGISI